MSKPQILTTVVGSYPVPDWLINSPSEQALIDATRVVINTQETAGMDVVCDGELYRFDINHPETNGMIEYFVLPLGGIRNEITFEEMIDYRKAAGMDFRKIKERYGQDLCLMGNIDPSLLTEQGNQSDIEKRYERLRWAVTDLIAATGGDGGFIFGTCSGLHGGMLPELVQFMYQLVSELDPAVQVMPQ